MSTRDLRLFALLAALASTAAAQAPACDRGCLAQSLDQYLNALFSHDPATVPLSAGFRQTENAVAVRPGTGLWKTATGVGDADRRYFDPISSQAAFFGIIEEGNELAVATVRVKVAGGKVSEAEWHIARRNDPGMNGFNADGTPAGNFFDPANLAQHQPSDESLPLDQRVSREELMAITNSYFDGLTNHDGSLIIAHPGCVRLENGLTTTGRPQQGGGTSDCTSGLTNFSAVLVADRRYPVVDTEKGVVLALGIFLRRPGLTTRRNVLSEWFRIEEGRIRTVHSAMWYPPPDQPVPNWPPYQGNWPLGAELAPDTN